MFAFQLPPEWLLSLAKLTAVLLLALVGLPLIKRPAMREAFWSAVFIILPLLKGLKTIPFFKRFSCWRLLL